MHPTEDVQVEKISSTTTVKPYRCGLCDFSTKFLKGLKQHNKVVHAVDASPKQILGSSTFCCNKCSFKSSYKRSLDRHKSSIHNVQSTFCCDKCSFKSRHKSSLDRHKSSIHNVHTISRQDPNLKVFGCETCSFKSKSEDYLEQHKRKLHASRESSHGCFPEALCRKINASCSESIAVRKIC